MFTKRYVGGIITLKILTPKYGITIPGKCSEMKKKDQEKRALAWMRKQAQEIDPEITENASLLDCARVISAAIKTTVVDPSEGQLRWVLGKDASSESSDQGGKMQQYSGGGWVDIPISIEIDVDGNAVIADLN